MARGVLASPTAAPIQEVFIVLRSRLCSPARGRSSLLSSVRRAPPRPPKPSGSGLAHARPIASRSPSQTTVFPAAPFFQRAPLAALNVAALDRTCELLPMAPPVHAARRFACSRSSLHAGAGPSRPARQALARREELLAARAPYFWPSPIPRCILSRRSVHHLCRRGARARRCRTPGSRRRATRQVVAALASGPRVVAHLVAIQTPVQKYLMRSSMKAACASSGTSLMRPRSTRRRTPFPLRWSACSHERCSLEFSACFICLASRLDSSALHGRVDESNGCVFYSPALRA
jgi:hypothetical protein